MIPLVLALLACSSCNDRDGVVTSTAPAIPDDVTPPRAPSAQPTVALAAGAPVRWRALDSLAGAELSFPPGEAAAGGDGHFALAKWRDLGPRAGGFHGWATKLPFPCSMPRPNYPPQGAKLFADGVEVPFNTTMSAPRQGPALTWYVDDGRLVLVADSDPTTWSPPADLYVEELGKAVRHLSYAGSGLSAQEFAKTTLVEGRVTRPGLFLPAPASATFDVSLQAPSALRFGVAILPDPVSGQGTGDGASVTVTLDGKELWKQSIAANTGWKEYAVDLPVTGPGGGKLRLESSPGADSTGDHVVLTSPYIVDATAKAPRRIVVVGIDTLRWDALSINGYARATSPDLDAWLAQSVRFDKAWSPAPRTKPSFRTAFTGLMPARAAGATTIADTLSRNGFATAGFVGNVHLVPRFGFARGMDHWEYENGADADDQVDRAMDWLGAHTAEDSFLFVHFMDPHTFYKAPGQWERKFQVAKRRPKEVPELFNRWQIWNLMRKRKLSDEGKEWIRGAYDGEVAYTAWQVSRLLAALARLPGETLTVIHTDHGEEFWEHLGFEHNHTLYQELVHVELAIRPPSGWQGAPSITTPVSLADIAPTIYDFAGVPDAAEIPTDGVSLRPLVDGGRASAAAATTERLSARPLVLGHMRYDRDRWGVVSAGKKYILHTTSGREELYDLAADPGEQENLAAVAPADTLLAMRAQLEKASGWAVRKGLRLRIPSNVEVTTITFDAPVFAAGVMDPEFNEKTRANLEWGEHPRVTPEEVGAAGLSADGRVATFTPGTDAPGHTWWVQCIEVTCPDATLAMGDKSVRLSTADRLAGGTRYAVEDGWVHIPLDSGDRPEAETEVGSQMEQLEELGYVAPADGDEGRD